MRPEFVSIVVPVLNEEAYIERTLDSLALNDGEYEILVIDGGSTDRTREIVQRAAAADPRIRLVGNPGRLQACAMNLAARVADPRAKTLVRADAHCGYPADFARTVASALRRTGAQSVVVPMYTVGGETCFQNAVAAAQNSRLGNGGSAHRVGGRPSGWVDHGHHAGFDREFFEKLGGYDESFATNEDAEYDVRVHKAGGRVWMETSAACAYHPRKTPISLARQYFGYGKGRAKTVQKHKVRPKVRQMVPVAAFAGSVLGLAISPFSLLGLLIPFGYAALCLAFGIHEARRTGGGRCEAGMGAAFMIMHMAWAIGFVRGMLSSPASST